MSPHTDWWRACEGRTPRNRAAFPAHAGPGGYPPDPFAFARARYGVEALPASGSFRAGARRLPVIRSSIPGQDGTQPGGWFRGDPDGWPGDWLGDAVAHLPKLAPDAVILGIVDMGIPLGHHRFRLKGGRKTRILASWQQASAAKGQAYLPFGQELCAGEIDALIDRHTHGSHLDEDAFPTATPPSSSRTCPGGARPRFPDLPTAPMCSISPAGSTRRTNPISRAGSGSSR